VFTLGKRKLTPEFFRVFSRQILPLSDLLNVDVAMLQTSIAERIVQFVDNDLTKIKLLTKEMAWVWEANAPYASDGEFGGGGDEEDEMS
jgi:hypothetical protein